MIATSGQLRRWGHGIPTLLVIFYLLLLSPLTTLPAASARTSEVQIGSKRFKIPSTSIASTAELRQLLGTQDFTHLGPGQGPAGGFDIQEGEANSRLLDASSDDSGVLGSPTLVPGQEPHPANHSAPLSLRGLTNTAPWEPVQRADSARIDWTQQQEGMVKAYNEFRAYKDGNLVARAEELSHENRLLKRQLYQLSHSQESKRSPEVAAVVDDFSDITGQESTSKSGLLEHCLREDGTSLQGVSAASFAGVPASLSAPTQGSTLRSLLVRARRTLVPLFLPGIQDALTAQMAYGMGFQCLVLGEAGLCSRIGLPDPSLLSPSDLQTSVLGISASVPSSTMMVESSGCFGGLRECALGIRMLEGLGVGGILVGDMDESKASTVEPEVFFRRVSAAVTARRPEGVLVLARTLVGKGNQNPSGGISDSSEEVFRRLQGALSAGADGLVLDSWLCSSVGLPNLLRLCERLDRLKPSVLLFSIGTGLGEDGELDFSDQDVQESPPLSPHQRICEELKKRGVSGFLVPDLLPLRALTSSLKTLNSLKEFAKGSSAGSVFRHQGGLRMDEMWSLAGAEELEAFHREIAE